MTIEAQHTHSWMRQPSNGRLAFCVICDEVRDLDKLMKPPGSFFIYKTVDIREETQ